MNKYKKVTATNGESLGGAGMHSSIGDSIWEAACAQNALLTRGDIIEIYGAK